MKDLRKFILILAVGGFIGFASSGVSAQTENRKTDGSNAVVTAQPDTAVVSVSGRIVNQAGRGISRVRVTVLVNGGTLYGRTNEFGYYKVTGIDAGSTCVFQIRHKRYTFAAQIVNVPEDLFDTNFTSQQ